MAKINQSNDIPSLPSIPNVVTRVNDFDKLNCRFKLIKPLVEQTSHLSIITLNELINLGGQCKVSVNSFNDEQRKYYDFVKKNTINHDQYSDNYDIPDDEKIRIFAISKINKGVADLVSSINIMLHDIHRKCRDKILSNPEVKSVNSEIQSKKNKLSLITAGVSILSIGIGIATKSYFLMLSFIPALIFRVVYNDKHYSDQCIYNLRTKYMMEVERADVNRQIEYVRTNTYRGVFSDDERESLTPEKIYGYDPSKLILPKYLNDVDIYSKRFKRGVTFRLIQDGSKNIFGFKLRK